MTDGLEQLTTALHGRYRVERELGEGGMATVYLAHDVKHDRPVALKVLHRDLSVSLGAERFLREIRIVAQLQHPHVVGLIDSGESEGVLYYVMPYVAGESLRKRLAREGELPIDEAVWLLREVADALAYAHAKQIVHRDIKPENVLVAARHAMVTDFGIARAVSEAASGNPITATGIAVGSPAYMAPEQAASDPQMDHRADLYAFGILAYELLTGGPPFSAPTAVQLVAQHMSRIPDPPSRLRPSIPDALDELILRCLAKHPADRFQTAAEVVRRLDALLTGPLGESLESTHEHAVAPSHYRISEGLVRRLSRESFDPRMIGDAIEYLDNHARSDVLVCFIPACGLDAAEFEAHLRTLPYRSLAVTPFGFERERKRRPVLSLADHLTLLRAFVRHVVDRIRPAHVLLAGYSSGADVVLRLVASASSMPVHGVLSLGCNLSLETCFVTRIVARADAKHPAALLDGLRQVGAGMDALDAWITVHRYLVEMMQKFHTQPAALQRVAADIVAPFDDAAGGESPFVSWYREVSRKVAALRCVFEDDDVNRGLVRDILLRNSEDAILGDRYREGSIVIEPESHHFDIERPDVVARHLEALVGEVRAAKGPAATVAG
ncbi:MAG TPA: serine/threonine-protein kinase [Gemmatimonadaceae bacterium]